MRCTLGELDMMEVPLPVHEPSHPPGEPPYLPHPDHAPDDSAAPPSPTPGFSPWGLGPLFQQGFVDCAQEAVRFLIEEEGLSADDPLVMGLKQHLLLNAVANAPQGAALGVAGQAPRMDVATGNKHQLHNGNVMRHGDSAWTSSQSADAQQNSCPDSAGVMGDHSAVPLQTELPHPPVSSTTGSGLISESDLVGVLSCLTYTHPDAARASHEHHSCHQLEMLPARAREMSFTSSESDADSSFNVSGVSVSDCGDVVAVSSETDYDEMSTVSDNVFEPCENTNNTTDLSQLCGMPDSVTASTSQTVAPSSEAQTVASLPDSTVVSELTTATTTTSTAMETTSTSDVVTQSNSVPTLSSFLPLMPVASNGLSAEEIRIRTLANEIVALLYEEAQAGSDSEDDDVTDDAFDAESEDMMIEIEQ